MWSPKYQKVGPPKEIKPRVHHPTLDFLECQAHLKATEDYDQDITNYLSSAEVSSIVNCSMIDLQPEIQWHMRPYLLDFLIEIHQSFRLHPQTLFLAISIIDKYCSKRVVFKRHYQLVGCTALWLAAKYEDKKSRVPTLKELTIMCRNAYESPMFVQMERHILSTLDWCLSHTSLEDCLQICLNDSFSLLTQITPKNKSRSLHDLKNQITQLTRFFCELSLYERNFLQFPNSIIAVSSHLLACNILDVNLGIKAIQSSIDQFYNQYHSEASISNENDYPDVMKPFLSGFQAETTIDDLRVVGVLLVNSINSCSKVLENKYKENMKKLDPLNDDAADPIQIIHSFLVKFQPFINQLPNSCAFNNIDEFHFSNQLIQISDLILGFNSSDNNSLAHLPASLQFSKVLQQPYQPSFHHISTSPSATSTVSSIFSSDYHHNYSTTSVAITPSTSPIESKHFHQKQNHHIPNNNKRSRQNDESCPGSSPLAQRSQNKLNIVV